MANFFIIIPTCNSARFLERSLASILLVQPGEHTVCVHIQDNESTDGTCKIAEAWSGHNVTFQSERDNGVYDAIARASKRCEPGQIMTWLGSDDMLMGGALATVASIFEELPDVSWMTGLPFIGSDKSGSYTPWQAKFVRHDLSAGLHDGRAHGFLMQEGTFWRSELWTEVGGVDPSFRLAGDWDLWRRFAQKTPLHVLDFPIARFTRRDGQASSDMASYYAEVDGAKHVDPVDDHQSYRLVRYPGQDWRVEVERPPDAEPEQVALASDDSLTPRPRNFVGKIVDALFAK